MTKCNNLNTAQKISTKYNIKEQKQGGRNACLSNLNHVSVVLSVSILFIRHSSLNTYHFHAQNYTLQFLSYLIFFSLYFINIFTFYTVFNISVTTPNLFI